MQSKTIAIFSNKGGVGKTFVAVNLAVSLAKENYRVLLLDLDSQAGQDVARMLNITSKVALVDILSDLSKIEQPDSIKEYCLRHSSGVDFLSGVTHAQQASHIAPESIILFLEKASLVYDYILVDVGKLLSEILITVFDHSNLILLVVTPDILSVYQTRWTLDILRNLLFPLKMVKLILNRAESKGGVAWQEVRSSLPSDIFARLPSEGKPVGFALNRGIPVVLDSPHSKVAMAFKKLCRDITTEDIFVEHKELAKLRMTVELHKPTSFWERFGLIERIRPKIETQVTISSEEEELIRLKKKIHEKLLEKIDIKSMDVSLTQDPRRTKAFREKTEQIIAELVAEQTGAVISSFEVRNRLIKEIADEALGLGPLEDLLADPDITDIMVNNKDEIYIERLGKMELTNKKFLSNEQVRAVIERIIAPLGRRIDESVPMVDARLPDGSRINAIIPPLSLGGPMLTIRKFARERLTVEDLVNHFKSLNQPMAELLRACVLGRRNAIVSGGTGSGKTTLLNILSSFIPNTERIVTIEDAAELKLKQEHWVRLESRPPNVEGKGEITVRDLFVNTLRMRPDRIIIGECRGAEVLDMFQAMNTGHDGSLTTLHANSTSDVLVRLDSLILLSGLELPLRAINEMIASAIDMIIHTARLSDGSRKVIQITEVAGILDDGKVNLKDIFIFKQTGVDKDGTVLGEYQTVGYIPSFLQELDTRGISLSPDLFKPK